MIIPQLTAQVLGLAFIFAGFVQLPIAQTQPVPRTGSQLCVQDASQLPTRNRAGADHPSQKYCQISARGEPSARTIHPTVADDLATIRSRIMATLLTAPDQESVDSWLDAIQPDGTWADIDYQGQHRAAWSVTVHLHRVADLARAYHAETSPFHDNPRVLAAALKGLDAWLRIDPKNPNWWWNQIGVPKTILPILLLLDDDLSESQRAGGRRILQRARIGMTGQNLIWVTNVTAGRGLIEHNPELVAK